MIYKLRFVLSYEKNQKLRKQEEEEVMLTFLWIAGMIAGFIFPFFFIQAIRSKDENSEFSKNTFLSCLTFGICILSILVVTAYS